MATRKDNIVPATEEQAAGVSLGLGWNLTVDHRPHGAVLRLRHPEQGPIQVEILVTSAGPVIRAAAPTLEIDAEDTIVARCETFRVEARDTVSIEAASIVERATGSLSASAREVSMEATQGDFKVRAHDDVQLLGETILLNCDRDPPLPEWVPPAIVGLRSCRPSRRTGRSHADCLARRRIRRQVEAHGAREPNALRDGGVAA